MGIKRLIRLISVDDDWILIILLNLWCLLILNYYILDFSYKIKALSNFWYKISKNFCSILNGKKLLHSLGVWAPHSVSKNS